MWVESAQPQGSNVSYQCSANLGSSGNSAATYLARCHISVAACKRPPASLAEETPPLDRGETSMLEHCARPCSCAPGVLAVLPFTGRGGGATSGGRGNLAVICSTTSTPRAPAAIEVVQPGPLKKLRSRDVPPTLPAPAPPAPAPAPHHGSTTPSLSTPFPTVYDMCLEEHDWGLKLPRKRTCCD